MASITKEILTLAQPQDAWAAVRDIGALHTRLVPGFVVDTQLEPGARVVTFGDGRTVREPIISIDDASRRLVWSAEGGSTRHYNASIQVFTTGEGNSRIVWIADFLPDTLATVLDDLMNQGMAVMKQTLDQMQSQLG